MNRRGDPLVAADRPAGDGAARRRGRQGFDDDRRLVHPHRRRTTASSAGCCSSPTRGCWSRCSSLHCWRRSIAGVGGWPPSWPSPRSSPSSPLAWSSGRSAGRTAGRSPIRAGTPRWPSPCSAWRAGRRRGARGRSRSRWRGRLLAVLGQAFTYHYFTDTVGAALLTTALVCLAAWAAELDRCQPGCDRGHSSG